MDSIRMAIGTSPTKSPEDYFRRVTHTYIRRITREIRNLQMTRRVFWEVQEIIANNPRLHSHGLLNNWLATNYGYALAIGLRRQMDGHTRAVSLLRLLRLVVCSPKLILRERFVSFYSSELQETANEIFDLHAVPSDPSNGTSTNGSPIPKTSPMISSDRQNSANLTGSSTFSRRLSLSTCCFSWRKTRQY